MDLEEFAARINPEETVLLLGAGASVPSGGQTGAGLAKLLCDEMSGGEIESWDLSEATSLLEDRYGRPALVASLAETLRHLRPDGGLLSLISLPWARAYTTNFDQLVEKACSNRGISCNVVRTNLDFSKTDTDSFELLKIHGCITRDRALGHSDSMILTQRDYDDFAGYRESLFAKLAFDMHTKDVLILGQSLQDQHLKQLVDEVATRAKKQATTPRVKILVFKSDAARLRLLEERNLQAATGSMAELVDRMQSSGIKPAAKYVALPGALPLALLNRTTSVHAAIKLQANVSRLFNGGSASYADIEAGFTFSRAIEYDLVEQLGNSKVQYAVIKGAAGVGKSTLSRRLLHKLHEQGYEAYEHVDEFSFDAKAWAGVAQTARAANRPVFLFIDEAAKHLAGINRLVRSLDEESNDFLRLVLSAHVGTWDARSKSGLLRRYGREDQLTTLESPEVTGLVDLVRGQMDVRKLLDPDIASLSRNEQIELVRQRSRADMFVALKYCFPGSDLDQIILEEYNDLDEDVQEIYRIASLLEATYAHPSRQLILEVLDLTWEEIPTVLKRMTGVLEQTLIHRRDGLYVWRTRHPVIAQVIAKYKYIDQDELYFILKKIIKALNAAMLLDRQLIPNLCDNEYAIGRLGDHTRQVELLELLCERTTSRVPWHRLIALWLDIDLQVAAQVIRRAEAAVRLDSPIARYKVKLALGKARELSALGTKDYVAVILDAEVLARRAITDYGDNKYSYLSLAEVGQALYEATGSNSLLREACEKMRDAYDSILDDALLRWRQRFELQILDTGGT
jgi:hypothetical protein